MAIQKHKNNNRWFLAIVLTVTTLLAIFLISRTSTRSAITRTNAAPMFSVVAVFGDSNADEYRADNNRGGVYGATTLNWVEQLAKFRSVNFGTYANWGGFRRTGYEYNFSLSGATTASALQANAHVSLGALVNAGTVPFVFYALGANDYAWYYQTFGQIYSGQLSGAALNAYNQQVVTNVREALDTINASHKAKMLVSLIPDATKSPAARTNYPDTAKLKRVQDAINQANQGIRLLASERGYAIFDIDAVTIRLLSLVDTQGNMNIGGEILSFTSNGDEPHHVLLSDSIHSGTVVSGLYANEWMLAVNTAFGTNLVPFTNDELLVHAGIRTATQAPSTTPVATSTVAPTSTPVVTVRPSTTPIASATPPVTPVPTVRPSTTPRPTATARPTTTPVVTATPAPTATPTDPYLQYCGTYRTLRSFLLRFMSAAQVREWDARCQI